MSELTEKEKAFCKFHIQEWNGLIKDDHKSIMQYSGQSNKMKYFNGAWDVQQSKIDELVKALEQIDNYSYHGERFNYVYCSEILFPQILKISSEALKKYRGEK